MHDMHGSCQSFCPILWPSGSCVTDVGNGLYNIYVKAGSNKNMKLRSEIAHQIANLPENKDT